MLSPDSGGTPRAIGSVLTNLLNRTKGRMVHGCMPTFIARKATMAMPPTGIAVRVSPFAVNRSMPNGSISLQTYLVPDLRSIQVSKTNAARVNAEWAVSLAWRGDTL